MKRLGFIIAGLPFVTVGAACGWMGVSRGDGAWCLLAGMLLGVGTMSMWTGLNVQD